MVAGAEQPPPRAIPDREGKIAEQMLDARLAPFAVGVQDQLRIGGTVQSLAPAAGQRGPERRPCIDARVGDNPGSPVDAAWLLFPFRLVGRRQQRMPQRERPVRPHARGRRPAEPQERRHPVDETAVDRRAVDVENTRDSAHAEGSSTTTRPCSTSRSMNSLKSADNRVGCTSYSPSTASYAA